MGKLIHSEEYKQMMRERFAGRTFSAETRAKISEGVKRRGKTKEHIAKIQEHINRVNERGFENKGGRCKFYEEFGLKVQGRYELAFLRYFKSKFPDKFIANVHSQIMTGCGKYRPDFDLGDLFIEIKSTYTVNEKQNSKIKWNNENNDKKVVVFILKESDVNKFLGGKDIELCDFNTILENI